MDRFYALKWKNANKNHIKNYVTFLSKVQKLKVSTIRSHLSAIAFYHQAKFDRDPTTSFAVKKLLLYYAKKDKNTQCRLPITEKILNRLTKNLSWSCKNKFYKLAFTALYKTMFYLALRISEVSDYSKRFSHAIHVQDLKIKSKHLTVRLRSFKHGSETVKFQITKKKYIYDMEKWLIARGNRPGPLFVHKNNKPFTRIFIFNQLKADLLQIGLNPSLYNTHSFRKGRATSLAQKGYTSEQIALVGRWKSNAFKTYICPSVIKMGK